MSLKINLEPGTMSTFPTKPEFPGVKLAVAPNTPHNQFRALLKRLTDTALNILMPPVCLGCHTPLASRDTICSDCWQQISFIRPPLCDRLGLPMPFDTGGTMISAAAQTDPPVYRKARAVAGYDGVMRQLIHDLKFRDRHETRVLFGRWLSHTGFELIQEADIITPVPLSRLRLLSRRFNQSAILACEITKHQKAKFCPQILVRTRRTKPQVGLTRAQRRKNVIGAFKVPKRHIKDVKDQKVLLIDDVVTTGATIDACARTLLKAGARHVDVLALARVTNTIAMST